MRKIIKTTILLIICIIALAAFITSYNKLAPTIKKLIQQETIETKLTKLNYSPADIELIKNYVSNDNINYIINENPNKEAIINFINETYFIDYYLKDYLNYKKDNQNKSYNEIVTIINTHTNHDFYTNKIKTDTNLGKYVILNKYYYADNTYPTQDIINVPKKYHIKNTTVQLNKECYEAFLKMYNDAYQAGYGFKIKSAYRSYNTQINTYNYWKSKDGTKLADTYSARAGHSEHQTGYAIDIRDYEYKYEDYSKSASFTWVSKNAHKYGFILRFPKGKEHITGYQYESWHYRYCGIECATYIYENNITYEEYYEYFIKFNNPKNLK